MGDETAVSAVLVPTQLKRFRDLCEVAGPIEPRFDGATKHVLLADDRAFLFPRNHTIVAQLLGRWDEPMISPYPFFAVTRLRGFVPGATSPEHLQILAEQLGTAIAACHDVDIKTVPQRLWANAWSEPPPTPPTATECYSPLRELGGTERLVESVAPALRPAARTMLLEALEAVHAMDPVLAHGDLRRHLWTTYAEHRKVPLPTRSTLR